MIILQVQRQWESRSLFSPRKGESQSKLSQDLDGIALPWSRVTWPVVSACMHIEQLRWAHQKLYTLQKDTTSITFSTSGTEGFRHSMSRQTSFHIYICLRIDYFCWDTDDLGSCSLLGITWLWKWGLWCNADLTLGTEPNPQ